MLKISLFIILFFCFSSNASAYIDPGTGSMLIQGLLALIAAIGTYISLTWRQFKNFCDKIMKKKKRD